MKNFRFTAYRITKYNPKNRDSLGVYLKDEWTSVSEICKIYEGKLFTLDEYLSVESNYIAAIKLIMSIANCDILHISELEKYNDVESNYIAAIKLIMSIANCDILHISELEKYNDVESNYIAAIKLIMSIANCDILHISELEKYNDIDDFSEFNNNLYPIYEKLKDNDVVTTKTLSNIMKLVLRELSWFILKNVEKGLTISFGYDYYMYINSENRELSEDRIRSEIEKLGLYLG